MSKSRVIGRVPKFVTESEKVCLTAAASPMSLREIAAKLSLGQHEVASDFLRPLQHHRIRVPAIPDDFEAVLRHLPAPFSPPLPKTHRVGFEVHKNENGLALRHFLVQPVYRHDLSSLAPARRRHVLNARQEEQIGRNDEDVLIHLP